ncbi:hypothetical protein Z043_126255 [Scleropages formosus]|uniref:C-type lectin domain-containing protein n=1 Tax=Scleropages formosus TaxID=113540 RepID=A0A0P7XT59_SCLFO|nr:hypothetical protein Z043_126255 [Scleropages formosus]
MDLVSVHSKEIQLIVKKKAEKATTTHVWLGLRYSCALNFWFWVSAQTVCYDNWASGNKTGNGHCGITGAVQSGRGHRRLGLDSS